MAFAEPAPSRAATDVAAQGHMRGLRSPFEELHPRPTTATPSIDRPGHDGAPEVVGVHFGLSSERRAERLAAFGSDRAVEKLVTVLYVG